MKANLTIPDLPQYNTDVLFLVVSNHKYGERVQMQISTQVIDHFAVTMTKKNCNRLEKPGNRYISAPVFKRNILKGLDISEYDLEGVKVKSAL